ncbi:MAG: hypothetical protein K2G67_08200 [Muribaculaceae bacterium]|nr:hypothetical protein [Muribaculaceae bacterium]
MKKLITYLSGVLMVVLMSVSFSSCSSNDDDADDSTLYDFSIVWSVTDYGDFTKAQANDLIDNLDDLSENIFEGYTTSDAKKDFSKFMESLRYEMDDFGYNITLKATLYNEDSRKDITSKTLVCSPHGATLK